MKQKDFVRYFQSEDQVLWKELGNHAHTLRVNRFGYRTTFVETHNINFTNVCTLGCRFCAFYRPLHHVEAYQQTSFEIIQKLKKIPHLTEVCVQGGIHPDYTLKDYLHLILAIRKQLPSVHIHAFSPQEIFSISQKSKLPIQEVLLQLKQAGLDSMPGTAAEILVDEVRQRICPQKIKTAQWVQVVKTAHRLSIPTSSTILVGHIESPRHIFEHFQILKRLQQETAGITEFIPLVFIPFQTVLGKNKKMLSLTQIKKLVILARIYFDGVISNIQMSWPKTGLSFALEMMMCGSNDIGGTLHEENISRLAGSKQGGFLSKEKLRAAIAHFGYEPVERDTLYQTVSRN